MNGGQLVDIMAFFIPPVLTLLFIVVFLNAVLDLVVNAVGRKFGVRAWCLRTGLFIACVSGVIAYSVHDHNQEDRMRQDAYAKAEALKAEVDSQFPSGAAQTEVVPFLRTKSSRFSEPWDHEYFAVFVGEEPSETMFCDPRAVGVEAKFANGRLVQTEVVSWHMTCL